MRTNSEKDRSRARRRLALQLCVFVVAGLASVIPTRASAPKGQFLVQCREAVKSAPDDPIVHPGHPGMSHMHEFYGNRSINASSTYESMIGQPTGCAHDHDGDEPGDTAGYWHPTLYVNGQRLPAPKSTFYYTNRDRKMPGTMSAWPPDLRVIAGDAHATAPQDTSVAYWGCGHGTSQSKVDYVPQCGPDDTGLTAHVIVPDCWDGVHLDSPDHKSHMAYSEDEQCPTSHPVSLPWLIMRFQWTDATPAPSTVTLSSGSPNTMHADFWNTWNQARLEQLVGFCINGGRDCNYEDLDNLPLPSGTPSTTVSPPTSTPTSTTAQPTTTMASTTTTSQPPSPAPPPPSGNLVTNPGFESGLGGWSSNPGTALDRSSDARSGAFSARLMRTGSTGQLVLNDSPDFVTSANGTCRIEAWVKGPGEEAAKLRVREYRDGRRHAESSLTLRLNGSWQLLSLDFVPEVSGALDINVYGRAFSTGQTLLVDDVSAVCNR
jgi:hypothetical protein